MERELTRIFDRTLAAHFPAEAGVSREDYRGKFLGMLREEVSEAPPVPVRRGNLATYARMGVLVLALARTLEGLGLSEEEAGRRVYRTAEAHFSLSPARRWIGRRLLFSKAGIRGIRRREALSKSLPGGINGFVLEYRPGGTRGEFGVDYLSCGIRAHFERRGMARFVKYCCLVDYAIMGNLGVSFSRSGTLANGADRCDFRFSARGPLTKGWPPGGLPEFGGRRP